MGVHAEDEPDVEQAVQGEVVAEAGLAGDLLRTVDSRDARSEVRAWCSR